MVVYPEIKNGVELNYADHYGSDTMAEGSFKSRLKEYSRSICTIATLKKRFPICQWLPAYTSVKLLQDVLAGITVGLTAIPQAIAYAVVAGLEPQYGLYAAFMGCFVYVVFGSCKDVTIGPTAILSLMVQKHVSSLNADYAILITFLSGVLIFLLGLLHLGFLVQFISTPVTIGFTSGAAMTILSSQLKALFGISGSTNTFMESIENLFKNIHSIKLWDTILGLVTIVILLLLKQLGSFGSRTSNAEFSTARNVLWKFNWIVCLSRNAVVVVFGCFVAWLLKSQWDSEPFSLTGHIQEGLPGFSLPPFSTVVGNETHSFTDMVSELGTSLITLPLISILESIAIAKAFSKGKIVDATQEMIALGLCNVFGSCVKSMPTTGSFTRTAVNNASGVQTQAGGIFTGCLVLLALGLLTKTFYFIPKATLAGLIICAMFFMIDYAYAITLWKTRKIELAVMMATFISCLIIGLEMGICIGVAIDAVVLLLKISRPAFKTKYYMVGDVGVLLLTIPRSLSYCAADHLTMKVLTEVDIYPDAVLVIDGSNMKNIDTTVAKSFKSLMDDMKVRSQHIIFWCFSPQARDIFTKLSPAVESKMCQNCTIDEAVHTKTGHAHITWSANANAEIAGRLNIKCGITTAEVE